MKDAIYYVEIFRDYSDQFWEKFSNNYDSEEIAINQMNYVKEKYPQKFRVVREVVTRQAIAYTINP